MKLIIDIPEDYYEVLSKTEVILTSQRSGKTFMSVIYSAVKNGIPLDDVKKEIFKLIDSTDSIYGTSALHSVLEILDNIGKAER